MSNNVTKVTSRIRNEMISMNQKMSEPVKILGGYKTNYSNADVTSSGKQVKKCLYRGAKNRLEDSKCGVWYADFLK